jgi:hypothetical protein
VGRWNDRAGEKAVGLGTRGNSWAKRPLRQKQTPNWGHQSRERLVSVIRQGVLILTTFAYEFRLSAALRQGFDTGSGQAEGGPGSTSLSARLDRQRHNLKLRALL